MSDVLLTKVAPTNREIKGTKSKKPKLFIALCTIPTLLLTIIFMIIPTIKAFMMSFTDATGMSDDNKFIFLDNYKYMFHDEMFIKSLFNTFKLMLVVPVITLAIGLVLAFLLTQTKLKERGFYRTVFFFPSIISLTVVGIIWSFVFHPNMGILNNILSNIGLGNLTRPWLGDSSTALWCVAVTLIWQAAGYYMVMYVAAIDGISPDVFESATIDGAGQFRKLISITIPLLKDIIGITFVLSLAGTINLSFIIVSVMTGGGPAGGTSVLLHYMYTQAFQNSNFGYAMAIAIFTLLISFVLSFLSRLLTNRAEG
ncbi:carbohydrate ABC transporter permease [Paenibacillus segetis]|uniref:ABC transporter permease protein YurN n=1 Tax=Paenibacillus segetis TaxID=1325360 RepID=A0ABQ1Y434_9BACL|nr:sugar ABC transporter permease [Paenibacillus segetis]GGH10857.1 putative ABC transporter permease protein YurN [Paenibacillus segetis]